MSEIISWQNSEKDQQHRLASGFTLIELLVVIGIIAVLAGMILPAVAASRSEAQSLRCLSNIRQLGLALRMYATDNKDSYPINVSAPTPRYWNDQDRIGHYLAIPKTAMNASSVFWCPADDGAQQSYSMNIWASSAVNTTVTKLTNGELWPHGRPASALLLVAESWSGWQGSGSGFVPTPTIGIDGATAAQRFGANGGMGPVSAGRWGMVNSELAYARHRRIAVNFYTQPRGRVSICFDDGHAALLTDTDLVDPQSGLSTGKAAWSPLDYVRN